MSTCYIANLLTPALNIRTNEKNPDQWVASNDNHTLLGQEEPAFQQETMGRQEGQQGTFSIYPFHRTIWKISVVCKLDWSCLLLTSLFPVCQLTHKMPKAPRCPCGLVITQCQTPLCREREFEFSSQPFYYSYLWVLLPISHQFFPVKTLKQGENNQAHHKMLILLWTETVTSMEWVCVHMGLWSVRYRGTVKNPRMLFSLLKHFITNKENWKTNHCIIFLVVFYKLWSKYFQLAEIVETSVYKQPRFGTMGEGGGEGGGLHRHPRVFQYSVRALSSSLSCYHQGIVVSHQVCFLQK